MLKNGKIRHHMGKTCITMFLALAVLSGAFYGCARKQEGLEEKILSKDPSFKVFLDKKTSLQKEMEAQKSGYNRQVREIEHQMNVLKEQKEKAKRVYVETVEKIKQQLRPDRRRLEGDLMEMQRVCKTMEAEIQDIEANIREINSLISKKDNLSFTQEEIRTWNERLSALIVKKESLNAQKAKLEGDIEVTRMKIKVLEL